MKDRPGLSFFRGKEPLMKFADMHCDTILELRNHPEKSLDRCDLHVDLEKLKQGGVSLQCFALFTDQKKQSVSEKEALELYDTFMTQMERHARTISQVRNVQELKENEKVGRISALLTLEEGDVTFGGLAMLRNWHRMGVRMIALTWNYENRLGSPNFSMDAYADYKTPSPLQHINNETGLTDFGKAYVREMERLGIIVDVSHLGDRGFWDVMEIATKPVAASHSNARTLCPVSRNLTDDMIRAIAKTGGIIGLNFCADFLKENNGNVSQLKDMAAHVRHILEVGGEDVPALGSDFDGITSELELKDASGLPLLVQALKEEGLTESQIEKFAYGNFVRVFGQVCGL